jgi:glutathione S-transferase
MTARFELSGIWLSGPTYKVGLMLALCGQRFDYVHVTPRGDAKTPAFMARQRYGQVPLLVDREAGFNLCQSASILEHLADALGQFGGATPAERIQAREWMFWDFDRLAAPIYRLRGQRLGFRSLHQATAEALYAEGVAALKVLDDHLAGRTWLVGDGATIADIDIYGVVAYAEAGGYRLADFPAVQAWMKAVEALPGFGAPEQILPKATQAA